MYFCLYVTSNVLLVNFKQYALLLSFELFNQYHPSLFTPETVLLFLYPAAGRNIALLLTLSFEFQVDSVIVFDVYGADVLFVWLSVWYELLHPSLSIISPFVYVPFPLLPHQYPFLMILTLLPLQYLIPDVVVLVNKTYCISVFVNGLDISEYLTSPRQVSPPLWPAYHPSVGSNTPQP